VFRLVVVNKTRRQYIIVCLRVGLQRSDIAARSAGEADIVTDDQSEIGHGWAFVKPQASRDPQGPMLPAAWEDYLLDVGWPARDIDRPDGR